MDPLASLGEEFGPRRTGFFPWVRGLPVAEASTSSDAEFDISDSRCSRFGGLGGSLFVRN